MFNILLLDVSSQSQILSLVFDKLYLFIFDLWVEHSSLCVIHYFLVFLLSVKYFPPCFIYYLSNRLKIHQENTKNISAEAMVWKCDFC